MNITIDHNELQLKVKSPQKKQDCMSWRQNTARIKIWRVPSGKRLQKTNWQITMFLMGYNSTISMAMASSSLTLNVDQSGYSFNGNLWNLPVKMAPICSNMLSVDISIYIYIYVYIYVYIYMYIYIYSM